MADDDRRSMLNNAVPEENSSSHKFPREKQFPEDTLFNRLCRLMDDGRWKQRMQLLGSLVGSLSISSLEVDQAIETLSDPWHPDNGGRVLLQHRDGSSGLEYRLVFGVSKSVIEYCESVWGKIPTCESEDDQNQNRLPPPYIQQRM